jgi:hypothetical protein
MATATRKVIQVEKVVTVDETKYVLELSAAEA